MLTAAFHARRLRRALIDLDLDPPSIVVWEDGALMDMRASPGRALTPPIPNRTLAEGLLSALKLAAAALREDQR